MRTFKKKVIIIGDDHSASLKTLKQSDKAPHKLLLAMNPKTAFLEITREEHAGHFLQLLWYCTQRVHTRRLNCRWNFLQGGHGLVIKENYSFLPQYAYFER